MRLFCRPNANNEIEWLKDGKPIYVDYDHVIFIKDDLIIRDPLSHADNGKYTCNGELKRIINKTLTTVSTQRPNVESRIEVSEISNQTKDVFYSFLKYQSENPMVTILGVGILAVVLLYIFSKIAAIYTEASINYAKYKFVKKGLNLQDKIEEFKAKRTKNKSSMINQESHKFTKLIEDEKWSLIL